MNSKVVELKLKKDCLLPSAKAVLLYSALKKIGKILNISPDFLNSDVNSFEFRIEVETDYAKDRLIDYVKNSLVDLSDVASIEIFEDSSSEENLTPADNLSEEFVRLSVDKLKSIEAAVEALMIIGTRLDELLKKILRKTNLYYEILRDFKKIKQDFHTSMGTLQSVVASLRTVPIEELFEKFNRVVRDICRRTGKKVKFIVRSENVEIDKSIANKLYEPLLHLVRNALDHGIEPPEDRIKLGKPEEGTLYLRSYYEGEYIVLEVEDDGAGIDLEKVINKAIELKLIKDRSGITKEQALQLIFYPGFSTKEESDFISGRGVGMDVVKAVVTSLRGSVNVETWEGKGTKFTIKIPIRLSVLPVVLSQICKEIYAFPVGDVERILRFKDLQLVKADTGYVVDDGREVVPYIGGADLLELKCKFNPSRVIIFKVGNFKIAVGVEKVLSEEEVLVKPFSSLFVNPDYLLGGAIMGDGSVIPVLNPVGLVNRHFGIQPGGVLESYESSSYSINNIKTDFKEEMVK